MQGRRDTNNVIVKPPRSIGSSVSKFFSKIARDESSGAISAASRMASAKRAASHGSNSLGSLTVSSSLWSAYEDSTIMLRIFFYALPCAFVCLAMEGFVDAPWFIDVALVTLIAAGLSMQNEWSSRAATLVRLYSGHFVQNLNTNRQGPTPFVLYDRHRDADCRVVREALSMLGLDVEIRPCPDPVEGVASPWLEELQALAAEEKVERERDDPTGSLAAAALAAVSPSKPVPLRASFDPSLPLPHLSSLPSCPVSSSLQGQGFPLVQVLLRSFALDPAAAFPLDLDEKPTRVSCMLASRVRAYLPWGARAHPIDWDRVHEARLAAAQAQADEDAAAAAAAAAASAATLAALQPGSKSATSPKTAPTTAAAAVPPPAHQRGSSTSSLLKPKPSPSAAPAAKVPTGSASSIASANHGSFDASIGRRQSTITSTAMSVALERSNARSQSVQQAPGGAAGEAELAAAATAAASAALPSSAAAAAGSASSSSLSPRVTLPRLTSVKDLLPLSLYGHESSAKCRPVFELACSLQLSYILRTCAQGSLNRAKLVLDYGSLFDLPTLIDPNTRVVIVGSTPCVNYLMSTYALSTY